jgi:MFS family permease
VLQDKYSCSKAETALAGSLCAGFLFIEGPIVSGFVNRFGCRTVSTVGALLSGVCILLSAFAPSLPLFILTYSVMGGAYDCTGSTCLQGDTGIAFGCVALPAYIHVSTYFETNRAFASGVAASGCGVGTFALAPLWSWTMQSGYI